MKFSKYDITHLTFLAGFHLYKPDHDFSNVSGKIINEIDDILNIPFDKIPIDNNVIILKSPTNKLFEINLHADKLIYEDSILDFEEFKKKSFAILEAWQSITDRAKMLRLAGMRRRFYIKLEERKSKYHSTFIDNYIKNAKFGDEKKKVAFHVNFSNSHKAEEYNINLNFDEEFSKLHRLEIKIDVNKIDEDRIKLLTLDKIEQIFNYSDYYYKKEFFKDLNMEIL